ncbi:MAG TPA: hypothetical protein VK066_02635 [Chloroflexota bacterium]|nr:hypothetical protein [Chloroflexota bacterium]
MLSSSGTVLALLALGLVLANGAVYWSKIRAVRVPLHPVVEQALMAIGIGLAGLALVSRPGLVGGVLAVVAMLLAGLFLAVTLTSRTPRKAAAVAVGQPAPDFTAVDADGRAFRLAALRGAPVLLKFFRGHW